MTETNRKKTVKNKGENLFYPSTDKSNTRDISLLITACRLHLLTYSAVKYYCPLFARLFPPLPPALPSLIFLFLSRLLISSFVLLKLTVQPSVFLSLLPQAGAETIHSTHLILQLWLDCFLLIWLYRGAGHFKYAHGAAIPFRSPIILFSSWSKLYAHWSSSYKKRRGKYWSALSYHQGMRQLSNVTTGVSIKKLEDVESFLEIAALCLFCLQGDHTRENQLLC